MADVISLSDARFFANKWISDWNSHNIEAILAHYAEPPEHTSPRIVELGQPEGTIRSTADLRKYFQDALLSEPPLHFNLIDVVPGVSSVVLSYMDHRSRSISEVLFLDDRNRIVKSVSHHR